MGDDVHLCMTSLPSENPRQNPPPRSGSPDRVRPRGKTPHFLPPWSSCRGAAHPDWVRPHGLSSQSPRHGAAHLKGCDPVGRLFIFCPRGVPAAERLTRTGCDPTTDTPAVERHTLTGCDPTVKWTNLKLSSHC